LNVRAILLRGEKVIMEVGRAMDVERWKKVRG